MPLGEQSHVRPRTRTIQNTPPLQAAIADPAGRTSTTSGADAQMKRPCGRLALARVTATAGRVPAQGLYLIPIPLRPFDKGCQTSEYGGKSIPTDRTGVAALQFGHDLEAVEHEPFAGFGELRDVGARIFWVALYADIAGAFGRYPPRSARRRHRSRVAHRAAWGHGAVRRRCMTACSQSGGAVRHGLRGAGISKSRWASRSIKLRCR